MQDSFIDKVISKIALMSTGALQGVREVNTKYRRAWLLIILALIAGCSKTSYYEVSGLPKYSQYIGAQFEIIGEVDACGIRDFSQAPVEYIALIAKPGTSGTEIAFKVPVNLGSIVTIKKVYQTDRIIFESGITFEASLKGTSLPDDKRILLDNNTGSDGDGFAGLNPKIYRKLQNAL